MESKTTQENRRLRRELERLEREHDALIRKAREYEELYEFAPDLCLTADVTDGAIMACNHTVAAATGHTKAELLGRSVFDLYPRHEHERLAELFRSLLDGNEIRDVEFDGLRKDRTTFTMSLSVSPVHDASGRVVAGRGVVRDISERKRAEEARIHLVRELDHRVKNTLATVQAIAEQTLHASASLDDFAGRFRGRVASMARVHEAISANHWDGLELDRLVDLTLAPFTGRTGRVRSRGPAAELPMDTARSLGMVLHELATNAGKYGALSAEAGVVDIEWRVENGPSAPRVNLHWTERDGPEVNAPSRRGFGRRMIEEAIPYELDGCVTLAFPTSGVRCEIEFPLLSGARAATHPVDPT